MLTMIKYLGYLALLRIYYFKSNKLKLKKDVETRE